MKYTCCSCVPITPINGILHTVSLLPLRSMPKFLLTSIKAEWSFSTLLFSYLKWNTVMVSILKTLPWCSNHTLYDFLFSFFSSENKKIGQFHFYFYSISLSDTHALTMHNVRVGKIVAECFPTPRFWEEWETSLPTLSS